MSDLDVGERSRRERERREVKLARDGWDWVLLAAVLLIFFGVVLGLEWLRAYFFWHAR